MASKSSSKLIKKSDIFLILISIIFLLVALSATVNAQTTYTVGAGTSTQSYPFDPYTNGYIRSASLYTSTEITSFGTITSLGWYVGTAGGANNCPYKIYLKQVSASTITADTWANMISGATLVYDATATKFTSTGWNTISISNFNYSANNLLVLCESNYGGFGGSTSPSPKFRYSAVASTHAYAFANSTPPSGNLSVTNNRPNIQITINSIPTLSATVLTTFGNVCTGNTAGPNSFTLTGSNLTANANLAALSGYTYCTTAGGTYTSTLSIAPSSGNINQVVYVKFSPVAVQSYNGNIAISSTGATTINVAASGSGIGGSPSITGQPSNQSIPTSGTATFTVTATGGTSYQWEEYNGSTWSALSNGGVYSGTTTASLIITNPSMSMNGYKYRCIVTGCSGSSNSDGNATLTVTLAYCTPAPSSVDGNGITNITFGSINNTTGKEATNYGNYSALSNTVVQGTSVTVSITYSTGFTYGTKIWVDYNDDGDFLDSGELVYSGLSTSSNPTTLNATFSIPVGANLGAHRMRIGGTDTDTGPVNDASTTGYCYTSTYASFEDYTMNVIAATPMVYSTSTSTQTVTSPIAPFSVAQQIIGVQVVTTGITSPLSVTSFTFNTNGTTNAANDIICATLYCTGTSSTFNTAFNFGTVYSQPNGTFTFTDSYTLSSGTNYFWLTYDVPLAATIGNILDAECTSLTVASVVRTPLVTNPGTGRPIANTFLHNNNNSVSACTGAYYDDGGLSGLYAQGTNYTKTFIPEAGKYMRISFTSFSTEATYDPLNIYDGPTTSSTLLGTWSGTSSPGIQIATGSGGELTVNFLSDNYAQTYAGWEASISCVSLPPNCASYTSPANGATNQPTNTTIVWTAPATDGTHNPALSYKLYFGTDVNATNIHNGTDIGNVLNWGMMLNTSTTYYWKIVPVNRSGEATGCNTIRSFTTAATQTLTTFTVCPSGCDKTTIKSAYDACTTASPYLIVVKSTYAGETYPIQLNADVSSVVSNRSAANPIIIRPDAGVSYTFTTTTINPIFRFSGGAKYITIDGRQGGTGAANSFVMQNNYATVASAPAVVLFTGDNSYNTIKYCKLMGASTNVSVGVITLNSPSGSGIRNITLENNEITAYTAKTPANGIYSFGASSSLQNSNLIIQNNKVYDCWISSNQSNGIALESFNTNCTITGNSVYFTSAKTPAASNSWYGIKAYGNNHIISNNYVGGTDAMCAGTPLTFSPNSYDYHAYGIVLYGSLATSSSVVSGNTVSNILLNSMHRSIDQLIGRGADLSKQTFAGIAIVDGAAVVNNNTVGGTNAGNITVINTNTTNPATTNDGTNWGYSAELVGIVYNTKNGIIYNGGNNIQGLWCYPSSSATTNLNSRVIGILSCTDDVTNSGYTHNITNNIIGGTGGLKAGNGTTSDAFVYGVYSSTGQGSIYINNNVVSNLWVNSTGDYGFLRGIHNNGGLRAEIENNTVTNLVCSANNTFGALGDYRNRSIVGVMCDNDLGFLDHFFVNKNLVYDLRSTASTAKVNLIGIYYRHAAAPVYGRVFANKIYSINASSSDMSSIIVGIWGYGQNTITYNNMVTLGSNVSTAAGATCPSGSPVTTGGYELRGIENNFGKNEYYFNSINIVGTTGIGASNSYAYKYVNGVSETWCRVIKNNIFSNTRSSTSGTAKHYAFSVNSYENCYTSDYNYFYVTGTNGVLFDYNGTDKTTIALWTAASGQDANSAGTSVTASPNPLFVDPDGCTCDLNITNIASPVHGIGTTTGIPTYILEDIYGNPRSSSNDMGAVVITGTLPVELLSFNAYKIDDNSAKIEWSTVSETNNDYFTVEKSIDGFLFEKIALVDGNGNTNSIINYKIFDNNPFSGINYYRLKQTDYDGKYSYSQVVIVDFSTDGLSANIYPNPFNDYIYVDLQRNFNDDSIISIYDITGKLISEKNIAGEGNHIQIQMDKSLPQGVYFLKINSNSRTKFYKIVKKQD